MTLQKAALQLQPDSLPGRQENRKPERDSREMAGEEKGTGRISEGRAALEEAMLFLAALRNQIILMSSMAEILKKRQYPSNRY